MNPGAAPTSALPGPVTRWTAWIAAGAALVALGAWALLVRAALAADDDPGIPPVEVLVGALWFGWPYVVAAPTAVVAASRVAVGVDAPARLLAFATSGRRGRRDEWGAAMRAELASITAPRGNGSGSPRGARRPRCAVAGDGPRGSSRPPARGCSRL